MVIKDMARASSGRWRDPQQWRNRRPREIRIHELVEKRREAQPAMCRNLVIYRGSRMLMRQRRYRLYTEYCQGGVIATYLIALVIVPLTMCIGSFAKTRSGEKPVSLIIEISTRTFCLAYSQSPN